MVLYLCVAATLLVTGIFMLRGKLLPKNLEGEVLAFRKKTDGIFSIVIAFSFVLFAIGDQVSSIKTIIHAIAVAIIAASIISYLIIRFLFDKKLKQNEVK